MKSRVLHISKYYYPFIGGTEITAQYLAEGLKEYEHKVICFNKEKANTVGFVNGIEVYRISNDFYIAKQTISFGYYSILKKIINEYRPDVIHLHCPNPFVYPILLKLIPRQTRLVVHWHLDIVKQKSIYLFIKLWETKLLKRADLILATSPNYRDKSKPLKPYLNKVRILQSAIRLDNLQKQDDDEEMIKSIKKATGEKPIVFFVGRHVEYKGLKYLVEAEQYIKSDCKVVIAGSGPLTSEIKAMTDSSRIEFIGRVNDNELRCYFYLAKIFAFPSITKNEAFGLALAEAMYCKVVPVTFTINGSGVNWVSLNGITGLEVPNKDYKAFAEAIDNLLQNDVYRNELSQNAQRRVIDYFTVEKEIELLDGYYNSLLKQ